ncbi:hypothetical protein C5L38_00720 [Streptomyces sp. WAC00288]|uniref:ROK family protein n=1 Tax=Streptomyces cinereoruber TaxID=67260 RepID=A0ABX6BN08_9ACTN|nr:hypothetical protein [Streptomyces sp. WAC04657]AVH93772.1 hypothetical protein C5L38_00720 [Streptomyces sp. WAC00288]KYG51797.1 hypothetical protein AWI43_30985 [Streptomyces sp. WAC04657]QEV36479.1 hypothetical protein CP977_33480 [Streptomyces cinereoruber]
MKAVGFDAGTGCLDVIPDASAYGTKVRRIAPKLITAANERVPHAGVRSLHVLPPAPGNTGPAITAVDPASSPTVPTPSVSCPGPSAGYRRALEAHRQATFRVDSAPARGPFHRQAT